MARSTSSPQDRPRSSRGAHGVGGDYSKISSTANSGQLAMARRARSSRAARHGPVAHHRRHAVVVDLEQLGAKA